MSGAAGTIEFSRWATEIDNDDLTLAAVNYFAADSVAFPDVELAISEAPCAGHVPATRWKRLFWSVRSEQWFA